MTADPESGTAKPLRDPRGGNGGGGGKGPEKRDRRRLQRGAPSGRKGKYVPSGLPNCNILFDIN